MGLPSLIRRKKKASFEFIKEQVWHKLQGWEEKILYQVVRKALNQRKRVLIKAVVQAIPTYTISCFKLLLGLCNEIEYLIKNFWWGQQGDCRKIHWVKWNTL